MVNTYLVEYADGDIVEYCKTLRDAKAQLQRYAPTGRIVMMQGQYFGEGFHKYYMVFNNGKYERHYA